MIEWTRNWVGDLVSTNTEQRIIISGSLSSSYPLHACWITMYGKDNTTIVLHDCKTTEDECKAIAEEWIKL